MQKPLGKSAVLETHQHSSWSLWCRLYYAVLFTTNDNKESIYWYWCGKSPEWTKERHPGCYKWRSEELHHILGYSSVPRSQSVFRYPGRPGKYSQVLKVCTWWDNICLQFVSRILHFSCRPSLLFVWATIALIIELVLPFFLAKRLSRGSRMVFVVCMCVCVRACMRPWNKRKEEKELPMTAKCHNEPCGIIII